MSNSEVQSFLVECAERFSTDYDSGDENTDDSDGEWVLESVSGLEIRLKDIVGKKLKVPEDWSALKILLQVKIVGDLPAGCDGIPLLKDVLKKLSSLPRLNIVCIRGFRLEKLPVELLGNTGVRELQLEDVFLAKEEFEAGLRSLDCVERVRITTPRSAAVLNVLSKFTSVWMVVLNDCKMDEIEGEMAQIMLPNAHVLAIVNLGHDTDWEFVEAFLAKIAVKRVAKLKIIERFMVDALEIDLEEEGHVSIRLDPVFLREGIARLRIPQKEEWKTVDINAYQLGKEWTEEECAKIVEDLLGECVNMENLQICFYSGIARVKRIGIMEDETDRGKFKKLLQFTITNIDTERLQGLEDLKQGKMVLSGKWCEHKNRWINSNSE